MKRSMLPFAMLAFGAVSPAAAQYSQAGEGLAFAIAQGQADDPLGRFFFPPELVMSNQRAIGLEDAQRETMMTAVRYAQAVFGELQMRMAGEMERLMELLQAPAVDSTASLQQLDRVLMHEHQIKRAHIAMLIGIRNVLTADQRKQLEAIRSGRRPSGF